MHPKYPNVFSPIKLGPVEIKNRFYFSPHAVFLTFGSKPTNDYVHYQVARAKDDGCGLIICSLTVTDRARTLQASPHPEQNIPAFRKVADEVHAAGAKVFGQIWYWWGATGHWQPYSPQAPSLSASTAQYGYGAGDMAMSTHEMSKDDIRSAVDAHRQTSANLRAAGFDGIMVHASHGGMIEQFNSPYFNRRTDEYGGSLDNRMRFLREVLVATREGAGDKMAVGVRFNCDEMVKGGYDTAGAREMLKKIADSGLVDYIDLDVAIEPNQLHYGMPPVFLEPQVYQPFVEAVRSAAGKVPVTSVLGRITDMAVAEKAIASGLCDMVGAARVLIAEPEFVKNAFEGKEERSRTCIACNWCLMSIAEGALGCTINPAADRERLWGPGTFKPAAKRSKVVVVGGGPGGLEAARVAATKGHDVTLFEARDKLGGALALWANLPGREAFQKAVDWWASEAKHLGVKVRLKTEATTASVLAEKPDAVIVATGAKYSIAGRSSFRDADIPGHDQSFVYRAEDILLRGVRPKGKVLVLDGEGIHTSVGIAEVLGQAGADVEYITPSLAPISPRLIMNQDATFVMKRLRAAKVKISTSTNIKSIGKNEVVAYDVHDNEERTIKGVDAVVLCTGREPLGALAKDLEGKVAQVFTIGDGLAARVLAAATFEGQKFARLIGEPGAPKTFSEAYFSVDSPEVYPMPADMMAG
jgi:2,4-dienoyl-CoA reductase-like NADH-dependent reductase (Old Yellow Enzyme family)/thioredoxin reductase